MTIRQNTEGALVIIKCSDFTGALAVYLSSLVYHHGFVIEDSSAESFHLYFYCIH